MTFKVNDQTTWVVSEFDCWFKIFISFLKKSTCTWLYIKREIDSLNSQLLQGVLWIKLIPSMFNLGIRAR